METVQNHEHQNENQEGGQNAVAENEFYLRLERSFDSPRDLVFQAWTDPAHLSKCWGPALVEITHCEMDVRVGGVYRTCMTDKDGGKHWTRGEYLEIDPPSKLTFTWCWEIDGDPENNTNVTQVAITLSEADGGRTHLLMTHSGFDTEEGRDNHNGGWANSLDSLEKFLASA